MTTPPSNVTQVLDPPSDLPTGPTGPRVYVAPLWRRTLAASLDLLAPLTVWLLVTWVLVVSDPEPPQIPPWNLLDQVVDYLHDRPGRSVLSILLLAALEVLWPVVFAGRTPGRRALGLELVDAHAAAPTRARLFVWALYRLPSLALAGVGGWWALVDPERRTLHDRAARLWLVLRSR